MSKTTKRFGSPEGHGAVKPPNYFSNPGQKDRLDAGNQSRVDRQHTASSTSRDKPQSNPHHRTPSEHVQASHRPATSSPRTITAGSNTADGNVKSSAEPCVKSTPGIRSVRGGADGYPANKGK